MIDGTRLKKEDRSLEHSGLNRNGLPRGVPAPDVAVGSEASLALSTAREETVREQMQARLEALRKEFETGQAELEKVERQRIYLRETMLRISGAVQLLEELLAEGEPARRNKAGPNELASAQATEANARSADQNLANLPGATQSQGEV